MRLVCESCAESAAPEARELQWLAQVAPGWAELKEKFVSQVGADLSAVACAFLKSIAPS